ncbi:hypothetical protein Tco_0676334, partial [Tanacetum coccineum]
GASYTQRKVYMVPFVFSIPFILSWGGSVSSDSFLPSILLVVVIIITVVIVVVILIVVIVVIVGVVIVFAIIGVVVVGGSVSSILKLSFVIIGWAYAFHQDKASSVRVPVENDITKILEFKTSKDRYRDNGVSDPIGGLVFLSTKFGGGIIDLTGDEDLTDEDKDTGMGDSIGVLVSLGGEISSGGKKYQE